MELLESINVVQENRILMKKTENEVVYIEKATNKTYTKKEINKIVSNYNKSHKETRMCFTEDGVNIMGSIKPIMCKGFLGSPIEPPIF